MAEIERFERERVQGQQIDRANVAAMQSKALKQAPPTQAEQIVKSLEGFTNQVTDLGMQHAQRQIELDKVIQSQQAIKGLDPTLDATRQGKVAHGIVKARNDLATANAEMHAAIKNNPNMTDEEFDALQVQFLNPVLEAYQDRPQVMKYVSTAAQEGQVQLYTQRRSSQLQYQRAEAVTASTDRLATMSTTSTPENVDEQIEMWMNEATAMGLGTATQRQMVTSQAMDMANGGDDTLLSYIEKQPWAENDASVINARTNFTNKKTKEAYVAHAAALGEINAKIGDPAVPWEEILQTAIATNEEFPDTFGAERLAQLQQQHLKAQSKVVKVGERTSNTFHPNYVLAKDNQLTQADRTEVIKEVEKQFVTASQALSPNELTVQQLAWSQRNEMKLPSLSTKFATVSQLTLDRELTESDKLSLDLLMEARETDIDMYIGGRVDAEYAKNIKKEYERTGDAQAAIKFATDLRTNRYKVTQQTQTAVKDEFIGELESSFNNWFAADIPQWSIDLIANDEMNNIQGRLYNSADPDSLASRHAETLKGKFTQIKDGTVINATPQQLASDLGYDANTNPKILLTAMQDIKYSLAPQMAEQGFELEDFMIYRTEGGYMVRTANEYYGADALLTGEDMRKIADDAMDKRVGDHEPAPTKQSLYERIEENRFYQ